MRFRLPMLGFLVLAGCYAFEQAWQTCEDAGRCLRVLDGGGDDAGMDARDAGMDAGDAGDAGPADEPDAGCAKKVFNGVTEVCPTPAVLPMHGNAFLASGSGSVETARAWCVEKGYLGVYQYHESGARNCNGCLYVTGSVGYGFVVQWGAPGSGCNSCGAINDISCY